MKQAMYALATLVLAGCFLTQTKPTPPQPVTSSIVGTVAIEDISGPQSGAILLAQFAKASQVAGARAVFRVTERPEQSQCRVKREAKAAATELLSVGQLAFGTALQTTHVAVEENAAHQYSRVLPAGFPAGIYHVAATGKGDVAAFEVYLQVPEALQDVRVNGQAFGSSSVLVRKSDPLVATWREPAIPNADHIIVMDMEVDTPTELVTLHCIGIESSFTAADGSFRWQVPVDQLTTLPESKTVKIFFVRAIVKESKTAEADLEAQGLRTVFTLAELGG